VPQKEFLSDLGLLIVRNNNNSICKKYLVKKINFVLMSKAKFPFQIFFSQEILPRLMEKTK
jgi:hypothetical protein